MLRGAFLRVQNNYVLRSEFKTFSILNEKPSTSGVTTGQDTDRLKTDDLLLSDEVPQEKKDEKVNPSPDLSSSADDKSVNAQPSSTLNLKTLSQSTVKGGQATTQVEAPTETNVKNFSTSRLDEAAKLENVSRTPFLGMPVNQKNQKNDLFFGPQADQKAPRSVEANEIKKKEYQGIQDSLILDKPWLTTTPYQSVMKSPVLSNTFETVPGPAPLRIINRVWSYVPLVGTQLVSTVIYSLQNLILSYDKKFRYSGFLPYNYLVSRYGPVVRLHAPIGADIVVIGVDGETVPVVNHKQTGAFAQSTFDTLNEYRKNATVRKIYKINPEVLNKRITKEDFKVQQFIARNDFLTESFIRRTSLLRSFQDEVADNYSNELLKWSLSCTVQAYFSRELKYFEEIMDSSLMGESGKLFHSLQSGIEALKNCESGLQMWRIMPTFSWSTLNDCCSALDGLLAEMVNSSIEELNLVKADKLSLVQLLLLSNELKTSSQEILPPLLDALIINVNVVANSAGFLFYHLAKNPLVQRKLFSEIEEVSKKSDKNAFVNLTELPYLKACILESMRLRPPFPYLSRVLQEDTVIHGYSLPKGTYVQMVNLAGSRRGLLAEEWGTFEPERWLDSNSAPPGDPLIGITSWKSAPSFNRDLVIHQIALLTYKMVHHFRLEHPNNVLSSDGMVLAGPNKAFHLKLSERIRI